MQFRKNISTLKVHHNKHTAGCQPIRVAPPKEVLLPMNMHSGSPAEPIVAATPDEKTYNQLALCWGVYPIPAIYQPDTNVLVTHAVDCAKRFGYVKAGDRVVVTAGGTGESGTTDVLKVQVVPQPLK